MPNISWQEEAWQKVYKSCESLLYQDIGQLGRDYLHSRSITKETAEKFIIGFLFHYDPMAMKMRPAISIPWFDNSSQICSVKIRFIDVNSNGSRYTSLKGSVPLFFGFSSVTSVCDKLVIVEGEMNAMSVWQTKPEKTAVISIGSDTNIQSEQLRLLARNFNQSFIWLDNIEKCVELRSLLPGSTAVQSQISGNVKLDANMMLQNRTLSDFISQMIK